MFMELLITDQKWPFKKARGDIAVKTTTLKDCSHSMIVNTLAIWIDFLSHTYTHHDDGSKTST